MMITYSLSKHLHISHWQSCISWFDNNKGPFCLDGEKKIGAKTFQKRTLKNVHSRTKDENESRLLLLLQWTSAPNLTMELGFSTKRIQQNWGGRSRHMPAKQSEEIRDSGFVQYQLPFSVNFFSPPSLSAQTHCGGNFLSGIVSQKPIYNAEGCLTGRALCLLK